MADFVIELQHLINCHSMENDSDTSDFILARYMQNCLDAFAVATRQRDDWYKPKQEPESSWNDWLGVFCMNVCECKKEKVFLSTVNSLLNPINEMILEAYNAGIKDINVKVSTDYVSVSDDESPPIIHVSLTKPWKEQQETKNTMDLLEAMIKFKFFKYVVPLNQYLRENYIEGMKNIEIEISKNASVVETVPEIYIGLNKC